VSERGKAFSVLTANTLAFTVCFAVWMMNGVLITFLVDNGVYDFDKAQGPDGLVDRNPSAHRRHLPIACWHVDRSLWWPRGLRGGDVAYGGGGLPR